MSHETAAPEKKHIRTLERRIAHLEQRLEHRKACEGELRGSATFEAAELAALRVAHELMRLYRDTASEDVDPTHVLIQRAVGVIMVGGDHDELVEELRERARLLEQLEQ